MINFFEGVHYWNSVIFVCFCEMDSTLLGFSQLNTTLALFCGHALSALRHSSIIDTYVLYDTLLVRKAKLCGLVVAKELKHKFAMYALDDGTGVVPCLLFCSQEQETIRLGDLVVVKGRLSEYQGTRQIVVDVIERVFDRNHESAWWLQVIQLHNGFYSKPLMLPDHLSPDIIAAKTMESNQIQDSMSELLVETEEVRRKKLQEAIQQYSSLEKLDIGAFTLVVKAYLEFHQFTMIEFDMVAGDPVLLELAEALHRQIRKLDDRMPINPVQTRMYFSTAFRTLAKQGFMFIIEMADTQVDAYELIRHDLNLGDAVLNAVRKCSGGAWKEFADSGVPYDMVGLIVRERTVFRNVSNLQIQRSLKLLQTQSLIIEVLPKHFKVL
ncbi:hypothetical protein BDR26DRAFT_864708 [Obelidium mucronatum]|nr:hypothetical protein BDR26DRAFT_864708 [Obelidium mucronatum]